MNILIICTCFAPDTAIAAVRPYMFAKYLSKMGHNVTVLRSGKLNRIADKRFLKETRNYKVISYLGPDCPAEKFERNELINDKKNVKSRISFLPLSLRKRVSRCYQFCTAPVNFIKTIQSARKNYCLQKNALNQIKTEHFDVVFSTYANIENIYAGKYAANLFKCKWIMDFRDLIVQPELHSWTWNFIMKYVQRYAVKKSDIVTTVSEGLSEELRKISSNTKVVTLYNGYEPLEKLKKYRNDKFTICYTGQLYPRSINALCTLFKAIKRLIDSEQMQLDAIKFVYAGPNSEIVLKMLHEENLEDIVEDYAYVGGNQVQQLQCSTDIFLVLSWNTEKAQGILTGKFYEGIRSQKPILVLVDGDKPNSELYELNQKYQYGFCYEQCRKEKMFTELCEYLLDAYNQKKEKGYLEYQSSVEIENRFRYDYISKELEGLCVELTKNSNAN